MPTKLITQISLRRLPSEYIGVRSALRQGMRGSRGECVLDPRGRTAMCWSVVMLLAVGYNAAVIPLRIGFDVAAGPLAPLDYVCDGLYLLNALVGAHTSYFRHGRLERDLGACRRHWLRRSGAWAALSLLPLQLIALSGLPERSSAAFPKSPSSTWK